VIGTRAELKKKGILTSRAVGASCSSVADGQDAASGAQPPDPRLFTAIDTRQVTQIPLPSGAAEYRVASLQDLDYVAEERQDTRYSGVPSLKITSPVDFWAHVRVPDHHPRGGASPVADRNTQANSDSQVTAVSKKCRQEEKRPALCWPLLFGGMLSMDNRLRLVELERSR